MFRADQTTTPKNLLRPVSDYCRLVPPGHRRNEAMKTDIARVAFATRSQARQSSSTDGRAGTRRNTVRRNVVFLPQELHRCTPPCVGCEPRLHYAAYELN